ncbi:hypothetical protein [Methylotenera sp.]|uniref:hypothetical protein n=1 Tax=Methylotenera sp. TaxID=2051956 RepID=UPI002486CE80|nr:hypothetical protein [Methylotenera sp.]MDI1297735.1 hypothetical protein [Methylotenera sp.]
MTDLDNAELATQPKSYTKIVTILALLKSFKLIELLAIVNNLVAIVFATLAYSWQQKLLEVLVLGVGLLVMYFTIRIRIDVNLFNHWSKLDIAELDEILTMLNPAHQSGRTLTMRVMGSYSLFKRGAILWAGQSILIILLVYLAT